MSKNLLLYLAVNGSRYSKEPSKYASKGVPGLPCTVEEVVNDVKVCAQAGVRLVHAHSRGPLGEHQADSYWYSKLSKKLRSECPQVLFCFATSRAGKVSIQINERYEKLCNILNEKEARLQSEALRLACLEGTEARQLPHFLTAFTATEVRMEDNAADIGHVHDTQSPEIIKMFLERVFEFAKTKNVYLEFEITTLKSIHLVEKLQSEMSFTSPISLVILPGFTADFSFSQTNLNNILPKARKIVESAGGGIITLGRVIHPFCHDVENKRNELIQYAVEHRDVDAIRVGIEDAPYWNESPSTNLELTLQTIEKIRKYKGEITIENSLLNSNS